MQRQSVREQVHGEKMQETSNSALASSCQTQNMLKHVYSRPLQTSVNQKHNDQLQKNDRSFLSSLEECDHLTQLYSKLNSETEKILKWKVSAELQLAQKEEKLTETQEVMERQRKNLFELQMHSEQLTHRLQMELKNRDELTSKIENTRKICNIVRDHCNQLTSTLNVCVEEKENLKSVYSEQFKEIEELAEKFKSVEEEYKSDVDQLEGMVAEERNQRNKIIDDANALHCMLNVKLEELEKKLVLESEKVSALKEELLKSSENVKSLTKEKFELVNELSLSKSSYKELENQSLGQSQKLEKELKAISTLLHEEKENNNVLKHRYQEAQEKFQELERVKDSIADENSSLKDSLKKVESIIESNAAEMGKLRERYDQLIEEKEELMVKNTELEELKTSIKKIENDYNEVSSERESIRQELNLANEKIVILESRSKTNEDIIDECNKEKQNLVEEIDALKRNIDVCHERISCANALEEDLKQKIRDLDDELQNERNQVQFLQSKFDMDTSELTTLLEKEKADLAAKELEIKNLSDNILKSNKTISDLQDQQKANSDHINRLDNENEFLKKSITSEVEKMDQLKEQLTNEINHKNELIKEMEEMKAKSTSCNELIDKIKNDNINLVEKIENLNIALSKVTEEKSNTSKKCLSLEKENEAIKNKSDSEIKEMVSVLEKYKRDCDEMVNQKEAKISALLVDMDEIKKRKEHLEEALNEVKQDNVTYQSKINDLQKEKEILEKTHQVKMMDLELKLTAKDKEMAEKEVALLKNDSDTNENIFSTPSRIKSPKVDIRKTPKLIKSPIQSKQYQSPSTHVLKEPNTPGGMKKQVTFQEESSDTDASSVDAMILDNTDLITRFEALERGVKMMTPMRVIPSPKNRKKRMEKQSKDGEKNFESLLKKARMNKPDYEETPRKNITGILKPLRQFNDGCKNTGLDLDELFEIVDE